MNGTCEEYAYLYTDALSDVTGKKYTPKYNSLREWYKIYVGKEDTGIALIFQNREYEYIIKDKHPIYISVMNFNDVSQKEFTPYCKAFFKTFFPNMSNSEIKEKVELLYEDAKYADDGFAQIVQTDYDIWLITDKISSSLSMELNRKSTTRG